MYFQDFSSILPQMTPITQGMFLNLLPPEFEFCTVGYRPVFFCLNSWPKREHIKPEPEKKRFRNLRYIHRFLYSFVQKPFEGNFFSYSFQSIQSSNCGPKELYWITDVKSEFTLILGYVNIAFNHPALANKKNKTWSQQYAVDFTQQL